MSTDAGMQELLGRLAPPGPGVGVSVDADLAVQVRGLVTEMQYERARRSAFDQAMAQAIREVPLLSNAQAAGTPATFFSEDWVCKTGFAWFLQLVTAKGLGSSDVLWVYRTASSGGGGIVDSAAKWQLNNANPAWHPGRTGFRIGPGEGITLQGTTTAEVTVSLDVIVVASWIEPDFLL